jgi:2-polyprenyl-6-methoxyphenol hydroxylase-like FAD-dependent oxidoreductase
MRTLIVGGGVAGLAAAISLQRAGLEVEVMEISPDWAPRGAALTLQSNALAMLGWLGLLESVLDAGVAVPEDVLYAMTFDGRPITEVHYPRLAGAEVPASFGINRAVLQQIMTARLAELGVPVQLGTSPVAVEQDGNGDEVVLASDGRKRAFDVVIAADGLRSTVRALRFPSRGEPAYSGFGAWRCTAPRVLDTDRKLMLIGPGKRLGIFPSGPDDLQVFAFTREPREARYAPEDWGPLMRERFAEFRGPVPDVFEAARTFHYTAVEEVPVERPLADGGVVLTGDAAHASVPFLAQGAAMALEDAVVLAECMSDAVASKASVTSALGRYEARRYPRVAFVQRHSLEIGLAWGGDAARYSPQILQATMQSSIDAVYAELARDVGPGSIEIAGEGR